jgi:hypothetical protein
VGSTVDLVVVIVETSDVSTGKLGDLTGRATYTTANIENLHALLHAHAVGKVMLMTGDSLVEGFAVGEAAEVEGLAPAIFVEIGCQVIVAGTKLDIFRIFCLS